MKQSIRIIGGKFRGKQLEFPNLPDLRPTPNRVRETLFNWLMKDIHGATCLDAFAGSGALGFEAFSRHAALVVLIEKSANAIKYLNKYAKELDANAIQVICADSLLYLKQTQQTFDIIFLDPPFMSNLLNEYLEILNTNNILKPNGLLYIESAHDLDLDSKYWTNLKKQRAGQVFYFLYRKNSYSNLDKC